MNKKILLTNHEALHLLDYRAREYLSYMNATLKGTDNDLYICYPNGKKEWFRHIEFANKYLLDQNPYVVYEAGNENDEPLKEFDRLDRLKEWCYLQKAADIAAGDEPKQYYYN